MKQAGVKVTAQYCEPHLRVLLHRELKIIHSRVTVIVHQVQIRKAELLGLRKQTVFY